MKKFLALIMIAAMAMSFSACGGEEEYDLEGGSAAITEETVTEAETETQAEVDISAYENIRPMMFENYLGKSDVNENEVVALSFSEDGTFGIMVMSTEFESMSFVGAVTTNENNVTIADETSGMSMTFGLIANEDGSYTLDLAEMGTYTVAGATADDVMYVMAAIEQNTEAVV